MNIVEKFSGLLNSIQTNKSVDINTFLGSWYELARM